MSRFTKAKNALALSAAGLSLSMGGQASAQENDRFDKVEVKTEELAPSVAVLFGDGGNIGVSHGEDGTILIDDQFAPLTEKIQTAVETLGAKPVKFLINTHWHGDHSGGNENFGKAGAVIMAHDNVRVRMAEGRKRDGSFKPSPKIALPAVTYAEGIKLHLNGEEVHVIGVEPAHTDGDSIIHWPTSNIIHMGDTFFFRMSFPYIDLGSGGNVLGVVAAADKALALANDDTKIIPGHGAVASKGDLLTYRNMIASIIAKVRTGRKDGKSLEEIIAMRPADGYDVKADGFIKADAFVTAVYKSLGRASAPGFSLD